RDAGSAREPATRASEKLRADLKPRTKPAPRATSDSRASPTPCASRKGARRGQDRPAWPGPRFGEPLLDRSRSLPALAVESPPLARGICAGRSRGNLAVKRALPRGPAHARLRACGSARLFTQES